MEIVGGSQHRIEDAQDAFLGERHDRIDVRALFERLALGGQRGIAGDRDNGWTLTNATERRFSSRRSWLIAGLITSTAFLAGRFLGVIGGGSGGDDNPPPH